MYSVGFFLPFNQERFLTLIFFQKPILIMSKPEN
ncbi:MAG: hypothetical protein ACI9XJ_002426, partial [Marivirga sp.]